jgi:hypothetical protein
MPLEKIFLEQYIKKFKNHRRHKFNHSMIIQIFTASVLTFIFSACSTLDLTLPIADLESPQHQGRMTGFGVEYTGATGQQIQLSRDASVRPINTAASNKSIETIFITKPGLNIYAWNRFTFTAGLIESKSPFLKMKVSLLSGFREDGEAGRWHASVAIAGSYQRAQKTGSQNGTIAASGFPWKGTSDLLNGKAGLSVGYQKWKRFTPFIGYTYQQFQTYGSIEQTPTTTDAGESVSFQPEIGRVEVYGFGIDWKPKPTLFIMPQVFYYNLKWYDKNISDVGGSIKISFVPVQ